MVRLQFKKLSATAKVPQKNHKEDCGYDLFADSPDSTVYVTPGETKIVSTNIAVMPGEGYYCDIRGRSGMNSKGKLAILGLVDSNYTGQYGIVLFNSTKETIEIKHHDKIAQFVVQKLVESELVEVQEFNLQEGQRGDKAFGASGN